MDIQIPYESVNSFVDGKHPGRAHWVSEPIVKSPAAVFESETPGVRMLEGDDGTSGTRTATIDGLRIVETLPDGPGTVYGLAGTAIALPQIALNPADTSSAERHLAGAAGATCPGAMESTHGNPGMNRRLPSALAAAAPAMAAAVGATTAAAATLVSLVGDKDGLGLGLASGDGFGFSLIGPADADGTDTWHDGNLSFVHTYAVPGAITSASLEIFSGGWGRDAPAGLYLNATFVGNLTEGDDVGPLFNHAFKDVFDLTPFAALLTGHDSVGIHPAFPLPDGGR